MSVSTVISRQRAVVVVKGLSSKTIRSPCLELVCFFHSMSETMEECIPSSTNSPRPSPRNRSYETTYQREYVLKRSSSIAEGIPLGQRFPIGSPYDLAGPINSSLYTADYSNPDNAQQKVFVRPNTNRANRPHPHRDFPHWPRKAESMLDLSIGETDQALRNQLNSIYQVDFTGESLATALCLTFMAVSFFRCRSRICRSLGVQSNTSLLATSSCAYAR